MGRRRSGSWVVPLDRSGTFTVDYNSRCANCDSRIEVGQQACFTEANEVVHVQCPGRDDCDHCGKPLALGRLSQRTIHATCASQPVDENGVCAHAKCCCQAHKEKSE